MHNMSVPGHIDYRYIVSYDISLTHDSAPRTDSNASSDDVNNFHFLPKGKDKNDF